MSITNLRQIELAKLRAGTRFGAHGMRDLVGIIHEMIAGRAVARCKYGREVYELWREGPHCVLRRDCVEIARFVLPPTCQRIHLYYDEARDAVRIGYVAACSDNCWYTLDILGAVDNLNVLSDLYWGRADFMHMYMLRLTASIENEFMIDGYTFNSGNYIVAGTMAPGDITLMAPCGSIVTASIRRHMDAGRVEMTDN